MPLTARSRRLSTCALSVTRHDPPVSHGQHVLGLVGCKPNESVRPVVGGLVDRLAQWAANEDDAPGSVDDLINMPEKVVVRIGAVVTTP
jgi:hypothetical protein